MGYADKLLTCERCGRRFVFTVEEQRRMAAAGQEIVDPTLCPADRPQDSQARTSIGTPSGADWSVGEPYSSSPPSPTLPANPPTADERQEGTSAAAPVEFADANQLPADHPAPVVLPGRRTGHVKWFDVRKGFGFIVQDDGGEIFVHHSGIAGQGYKRLRDGEPVSYEVETTDKGPQAIEVIPLEEAEETSPSDE